MQVQQATPFTLNSNTQPLTGLVASPFLSLSLSLSLFHSHSLSLTHTFLSLFLTYSLSLSTAPHGEKLFVQVQQADPTPQELLHPPTSI